MREVIIGLVAVLALAGCGAGSTSTSGTSAIAGPTTAPTLNIVPVAQEVVSAATKTVTRTKTVTKTVTRTVTAKPKPAAKKPAVPAGSFAGDGMYRVGSDIKPGTYKTTGGKYCYWARLKGADGSVDSIIANGLPTGVAFVEIQAGDKYFETKRCGRWVKTA